MNTEDLIRNRGMHVFTPFGELPYTGTSTQHEAALVSIELKRVQPEYDWWIEAGPKSWRTGKPICWIVKAQLPR